MRDSICLLSLLTITAITFENLLRFTADHQAMRHLRIGVLSLLYVLYIACVSTPSRLTYPGLILTATLQIAQAAFFAGVCWVQSTHRDRRQTVHECEEIIVE